jgi:hypothetical protein
LTSLTTTAFLGDFIGALEGSLEAVISAFVFGTFALVFLAL